MHLALSDPLALTFVALGVIAGIALVIWNAIRARKLRATFNELAFAALDGRPEEARVQARSGGRALGPLLDALGGKLAAPQTRSWLGDALMILGLHLPAVLLTIYATSVVRTVDTAARLPAASALFLGLAVMWPVAFAASVIVVSQSRSNARALRATCITLIAKSVKAQVDTELSESLRRGPARDPRGE